MSHSQGSLTYKCRDHCCAISQHGTRAARRWTRRPPEFAPANLRVVLVEASPVDRIWGIGLARDDARAHNPLEWRGLNLLGFSLMKVRDELRRNLAAPQG